MNAPMRVGMLNRPRELSKADPVSGVYSLTNIVTGGRYIGSTCNLSNRWKGHCVSFKQGRFSVNARIADDLEAFGIEAFAVDLIELVEPDDMALETAEHKWIQHYACTDRSRLYNIILKADRSAVRAYRDKRRQRAAPGGRGAEVSDG